MRATQLERTEEEVMTWEHYPATRLDRERAALLLIDHQVGLLLGVHDHDQEELRRNVIALARIAKAFRLPTVLTTAMADGPNGLLLPELAAELPGTPVINRDGEIDPFDNADFRAAVEATGRNQLIIAGISTDVCTAFPAMSAVAAGYQVHGVLDASGTWNVLAEQAAALRMQAAGVVLSSAVGVGSELQHDWRAEGSQQLVDAFTSAIPFYESLMVAASRRPRLTGLAPP